MKRALALVALVVLVGSAAGCAPWIAAPDDYAAYRKTRIAPTLEDRLVAADAYLVRFPEGAFHAEVQGYFTRAEAVFYLAKEGTVPGLEAYLRTLPKGPHGALAEGRLDALKTAQENREASLGTASATSARLDRAEMERRQAREQIAAWIDRFLDASVWKAPLSEARAELIVPWSLALPVPVCKAIQAGGGLPEGAARRCAKLLELPYAVRVNGATEPRQATVEIVILEDAAGRPLQASVGGPDLFLRLEETYTIRAIEPGDTERRVASIGRAVEVVKGAFTRAVAADPACKRPVVAPVFLDLGCQGVRVTARAAIEPGEDDLVVVSPLQPPL